jgi:hypothetical protein
MDLTNAFSSSGTVQGTGAQDYLKRVNKIIHCSLLLDNWFQQAVASLVVTGKINCRRPILLMNRVQSLGINLGIVNYNGYV